MFEPLSFVLNILAVGMAGYALWVARRAWRALEAGTPLFRWEDEIADLSDEFAQTVEQLSGDLGQRSQELTALLERAERILQTLEARQEELGQMVDINWEDGKKVAPEGGDNNGSTGHDVDYQIRQLAAQGLSVREIAQQVRLTQEEVALRLKISKISA